MTKAFTRSCSKHACTAVCTVCVHTDTIPHLNCIFLAYSAVEDEFDIPYAYFEARKEKKEVAKRKEELWSLIEKHGYEYTPITHFYHATRGHLKDTILEEHCLKRSTVSLYMDSVHSPAHQKLKGVFFTCNLRDGVYPSISPYGTERVKIPIDDFFTEGQFQLFFNSFNPTSRDNYCVVMVLVRTNAPEYYFCCDHLVPLPLQSNEFLRLDSFRSTYSCCQVKYSMIKLWLELIVVSDVPVKDDYEWDTFRKYGSF